MIHALVVDDREDNRYMLRVLLQGHGYTVDEARHGAEALGKARLQPPTIVVSDLLMPVMDGYALLRRWKADQGLRRIPFVVYTATYTDPSDQQLALDLGADAFIVKPAEPEHFMRALNKVLGAAEMGELTPANVPVDDGDQSLEAYNATLVRKLEHKAEQLERRVAEREDALRRLGNSEARYRALVDHSRSMILLTAPDGQVFSANPAACKALGMSEAQICAAGRAKLTDPDDPGLAEMLAKRKADGHASGEMVLIRGDGSRMPVEYSSAVFRDDKGRERTSFTMHDISAHKAAARELAKSHARVADLQAAIDAHALVSITDDEGRITFANDRFCAVSGYAREELLGRTHAIVKSGHHPDSFFADLWASLKAGRVWYGEICNRAKDGRLFWVDATLVPFLDEAGKPYQYVAIRNDITERKQAESLQRELEGHLRQAQKMQAVGTLAGGIAHDFNNIVAAILGYVTLASQDIASGDPVHGYLVQIQNAGRRARSLVQQILSFSRPQPTRLVNVHLQALVQETLNIVRATMPRVVTLHTDLDDVALHVAADGTQLQQVLLNLCTNAWHAMSGHSGRIEVGLRAVELGADHPLRPAELEAGAYVHLWVADNGCGMDEPTRARIFEPFFTTKAVGQGTGLGLAAVHGIVKAHRGVVLVDSRPGVGSTFHIYLPRIETHLNVSQEVELDVVANGQGTGQHILCVDDDETLLVLADTMLSRAGYRVTSFTDASQAVAAVRAQPEAFDLVLTDYNMPGLSGLDIARELHALRPDLPVIVSSGNVDDGLREGARGLGLRALLHKERMADDLLAMVRTALRPAAD